MLGKSCPCSTRIQLTRQSQPLLLDGTGRFLLLILGAEARGVGVLDIPSFGTTSIADRQAGPMVLPFVKNFNTIWHLYTTSVFNQILRWYQDE